MTDVAPEIGSTRTGCKQYPYISISVMTVVVCVYVCTRACVNACGVCGMCVCCVCA